MNLLDEPDEAVFLKIKEEILQHGHRILPYVQEVYDNSFESILRRRSKEIIDGIHFDLLLDDFKRWDKGSQSIEEAIILLSKIHDFEFQKEDMMSRFAVLYTDVWRELNDHLTALEKTKIINHIVFEVHHYGVYSYRDAPEEQYFVPHNLAYKRATEISICAIYLWIAEKLDLPLKAVVLPQKLILAYLSPDMHYDMNMTTKNRILFYTNPADRGAVFTRKEVYMYLEMNKITKKSSYFEPISNREFVKYYLNIIKDIENPKYKMMADEIERVLSDD